MRLTVKLFAYFRDQRFNLAERDYPPGTTVGEVVDHLDIPREEVGVVMRNSRHCELSQIPEDGDVVAIFPVIGGG